MSNGRFYQKRVKNIKLNSYCNVVMILKVKADNKGIYNERFRINNNLTIKSLIHLTQLFSFCLLFLQII